MKEKNSQNLKHAVIFGAKNISRIGYIDDYIFACELKGEGHIAYNKARRPKYHLFIIVLEGHIDLIINGNEYHFGKASYINLPTWSEVYEIRYDKNFHAMATATDKSVVEDIFRNRNPFPPDFEFKIAHSLGSEVRDTDDLLTLRRDIDNLIDSLQDRQHHFAEEINYAYFYILLIDMADMIWRQYGQQTLIHNTDMTRAESILKDFSRLVSQHIHKETGIEFYAKELCISKQYLSLVVKQKTGITIGAIIASMRAEAAARLLRNPDMTIQQVAETLSFADQSSFGKFFRKQMGIPPMKYRRRLRKTLLSLR